MGNLSQLSHYGESLGVQKGESKCSQSKALESEAIMDPICVLTHLVNVQSTIMEKGQGSKRDISEIFLPYFTNIRLVFSSPDEIANILGETFQSVSSAASYNSRFLEIKRRAERTPISFSTRSFFPHNCDFTMTELQKALLQAHNTSPGPDGITYTMLCHLNPNSLANILFLFNRVWKEHCFSSNWREAIVIPILKPGKG
ncbi:putative RNA-directed DNA polymerase from transposon X-element [Trichonephila clavipes]|nr:putative RNA-directed DNA polymerase from transposon X-element [Trichonephila clavipes]